MKLFPGGARQRARVELQEQLVKIFYRLETLETAQAPEYDLELLRGIFTGLSDQTTSRLAQVEQRLLAIEGNDSQLVEKLKVLTFAVAEGIERVDRSERRIHATIKRARKELADSGFESPRLEAEAAELQLVDGKGGTGGELPDVPASVDVPDETPSSIRGVPASTLRKVRGF